MKQRCHNPNNPSAEWYYYKGIRVCPEWRKNFYKFQEWALDNGYFEGATIDRIDSNKGYYPENCQWLTLSDNAKRNKGKKKRNRKKEKEIFIKAVMEDIKSLSRDDFLLTWGFILGLKAQEEHHPG